MLRLRQMVMTAKNPVAASVAAGVVVVGATGSPTMVRTRRRARQPKLLQMQALSLPPYRMKVHSQTLKLLSTHRLMRQWRQLQNRHPPLLKLSLSPRQNRNPHQNQSPLRKLRRSLSLKPLLSLSLRSPLVRRSPAGGVASALNVLP